MVKKFLNSCSPGKITFGGIFLVFAPIAGSLAATANVTIDASKPTGTFKTIITAQLAYLGEPEAALTHFQELAPASPVRIHMSSEDTEQANLPEKVRGKWDFKPLDTLVNRITSYGGHPMLNPKYPPDFMWSCGSWQKPGTILDGTFRNFGDYLARLVSYYNKGSMTTESGEVITNPAGTRNRVDYWEIWNEPDLSDETPCKPEGRDMAILPEEYVTMWNAVVPRMLKVDSTLKLIGPTVSIARTQGAMDNKYAVDYIPALMAGAVRKPDIISFHGYGGWKNESTDLDLFEGGGKGEAAGMTSFTRDLELARGWAPGLPVWITELNVNAGWKDDPKKRPWTAYGTAWMCSTYYHLGALGGVGLIAQYCYWGGEGMQDTVIEVKTGERPLPYWRDYYVPRYFPKGSTLLSTSSSQEGIEVMAANPAGSKAIRVMVINRQVANPSDMGGKGVPTTVQVRVASVGPMARVTERLLDNSTPSSGPPVVVLPASGTVNLLVPGYGVALLEFVPKPLNPAQK